MSSNGTGSDLCPRGFWIVLRQAINTIGDGESGSGIEADKKNFKRKADLDDTLYIEHGHSSKVKGYKLCEFVYVSKPGTRASASLGLTLSKWCKLNLHLSNEENWSSLSEKNKKAFKSYTGVDAIPDNIRLAFKMGVLTSSQTIQDIINKGENEKKEAKNLEAISICSKGCDHKRLPEVTNTPHLKQIGIVIDGAGTYRSDRCQNADVIDGRCRFCRNKKRNLRSKQWNELMKPPPETVEEADTADLLSTEQLEQEVIERIDILNKQKKLDCIPDDRTLLQRR